MTNTLGKKNCFFTRIIVASLLFFLISCNQNVVLINEKMKGDFPERIVSLSVQTNRDTTVNLEGLSIQIPAGAFSNEDGVLTKNTVQIKIHLFTDVKSMLTKNLFTKSGNRLLESNGMVYMDVLCNEKSVKITNGKSITLKFETKNIDDVASFSTFYGQNNADSFIDWELSGPFGGPGPLLDTILIGNNTSINTKSKLYNAISVIKLGWINCDKFWDMADTSQVIVKADVSSKEKVFCSAIISKHKSIVPGFLKDGQIEFSPLPLNEEVSILLIGTSGDDYNVGYETFTTSKAINTFDVPMKTMKKEELDKILDEINGKSTPMF